MAHNWPEVLGRNATSSTRPVTVLVLVLVLVFYSFIVKTLIRPGLAGLFKVAWIFPYLLPFKFFEPLRLVASKMLKKSVRSLPQHRFPFVSSLRSYSHGEGNLGYPLFAFNQPSTANTLFGWEPQCTFTDSC